MMYQPASRELLTRVLSVLTNNSVPQKHDGPKYPCNIQVCHASFLIYLELWPPLGVYSCTFIVMVCKLEGSLVSHSGCQGLIAVLTEGDLPHNFQSRVFIIAAEFYFSERIHM